MTLRVKTYIAFVTLLGATNIALAQQKQPDAPKQNVRPELRQGNKLYNEKKYKEAQLSYAAALQKDPTSQTGLFNMGDALYKNKDYENSRKVLEASAKTTKDKKEQARAYHNIGNSYMEEKKWEDAINAYKQSLKLDPTDADTKYNLAYANAMLKKDGGGKNNKNNKDKNKDNKDKKDQDKKDQDKKDQDKKDQDKKDQDKKDQDKKDGDKGDKDQQQKQPQAQPSKLSKQEADNILNALQQDEKKLQDKKEKGKGVPVKMEKDW